MLKRANFYYRNPCPVCEEAKTFLEDQGILLEARDLGKMPFKKEEIKGILRNFEAKHFIDPTSAAFTKAKLDKKMPSRKELIDLIEQYPELLRHPIVTAGRLLTVGAGRKQLIDMFQLTVSDNGSGRVSESSDVKAKNSGK